MSIFLCLRSELEEETLMCRDKTLRPATGLAFLLAASLAPACYFPNVEAVKVKMLDECGVAPNGPWCCLLYTSRCV